MSSYYSQSVSASLRKIASETTQSTKPVTPDEARVFFSSKKLDVPVAASEYIKKIAAYRRKAATANFGSY